MSQEKVPSSSKLLFLVGFLSSAFAVNCIIVGWLIKERAAMDLTLSRLEGDFLKERAEWGDIRQLSLRALRLHEEANASRETNEAQMTALKDELLLKIQEVSRQQAAGLLEKKRKYAQIERNFDDVAARLPVAANERRWDPLRDKARPE